MIIYNTHSHERHHPKGAETDGADSENYLSYFCIKQIYIKYINKYTVYMW